MKKSIISLAFLLSLAAIPQSWAVVLTSGEGYAGTWVGDVDTIVAQDNSLTSSTAYAEQMYVESVLGSSVYYTGRTQPVNWFYTDTANTIAFSLWTGPGHYVVKNDNIWILMENLVSDYWGVLDMGGFMADLETGGNVSIHHVTEFNGHYEVSEPGSLALLGIGLLGFALVMRRRQS